MLMQSLCKRHVQVLPVLGMCITPMESARPMAEPRIYWLPTLNAYVSNASRSKQASLGALVCRYLHGNKTYLLTDLRKDVVAALTNSCVNCEMDASAASCSAGMSPCRKLFLTLQHKRVTLKPMTLHRLCACGLHKAVVGFYVLMREALHAFCWTTSSKCTQINPACCAQLESTRCALCLTHVHIHVYICHTWRLHALPLH